MRPRSGLGGPRVRLQGRGWPLTLKRSWVEPAPQPCCDLRMWQTGFQQLLPCPGPAVEKPSLLSGQAWSQLPAVCFCCGGSRVPAFCTGSCSLPALLSLMGSDHPQAGWQPNWPGGARLEISPSQCTLRPGLCPQPTSVGFAGCPNASTHFLTCRCRPRHSEVCAAALWKQRPAPARPPGWGGHKD